MKRPWTRRARALHEELRATRAGYDAALAEAGTVLFQQVAPEVDAHHVSASATDLLGWDAEAFQQPGALRAMVHPDDLDIFRSVVPIGPLQPPPLPGAAAASPAFALPPAVVPAPVAAEPVVRLRTVDGRWRHVLIRRSPGGPGAPVRGALVDLTAGAAERARLVRCAELVEASADAMLVLAFADRSDPNTLVIRWANGRARRLFRLEERLGRPGGPTDVPIGAVLGGGSAQLLRSALFDVAHTGEPLTAERLTFVEVPGTHLDLRVERLGDGTLGLTIVDVSHTVEVEQRLRHQVTHDTLTGLPNRTLFEQRVAVALAALPPAAGADVDPSRQHPLVRTLAARRPGSMLGVLAVDVDGLAQVNADHGHGAGDRLLAEVARRLADERVGAEVAARTGGTEFALLTPPAAGPEGIEARVEALRRLLDEPVEVDGHLLTVGATVGHAVAPADGDDAATLLRAAEASLHQARSLALPALPPDGVLAGTDAATDRTGTGVGSGVGGGDGGDVAGRVVAVRGIGLLTELRQGLANRELELRFQPVVDLRTGRVTKVEALLRWQRDTEGTRAPVELMELAERSGLVQPLTRWVLGEAARAASLLDAPGHPTVVSTNLSLRNLHDAELLGFIELLVASGELDPRLVELELSETELMDDPAAAREVLGRLAALGLRVVVDEFGSGYTSVSTLAGLDIAGVKIDRSFVSTLAAVPADVAVVRSTVLLAHELGLGVAAEGVADATSLGILAEVGCDLAQGLHLSGPVTLDDLADRVADLEAALAGWVATADAG